jgi:hypothetical protein
MAATPAKASVNESAEISGFLNQVFTFYLPIDWFSGGRTAAAMKIATKERTIR